MIMLFKYVYYYYYLNILLFVVCLIQKFLFNVLLLEYFIIQMFHKQIFHYLYSLLFEYSVIHINIDHNYLNLNNILF